MKKFNHYAYLFIIRDKSTGEVWFTGTVYEPIEHTEVEQ